MQMEINAHMFHRMKGTSLHRKWTTAVIGEIKTVSFAPSNLWSKATTGFATADSVCASA
jgi:hypothetical protein